MMSGNHTIQSSFTVKSMTDQAKLSYITKMKHSNLNLSNHQLPFSSDNTTTSNGELSLCTTGYALPRRKVFCYTAKPKSLLMEMFLEGKECEKKMSPEEVYQQLWIKLKPIEYVTSQQIGSLFSRYVVTKLKNILTMFHINNGIE